MQLLVSFARVRPPGRAALGLLDPDQGRFRIVLELPEPAGRCDGLLALASSDRFLYATAPPFRHLGESEPSLLVFRAEDLMPEGRYLLFGLDDPSALIHHDGSLYVASGGTGEVVAFRADGAELDPFDRFAWRPRIAVEGKADPRLRALAVFRNEFYAAGADRDSVDAFLFNITRDLVAARALQDPRALAVVGHSLAYAAGRFGAVHRLGDDLDPVRSAGIAGDVVALVEADGAVFAASSAEGRCAVHRLSADDLILQRSFELPVDHAEVSWLLPIEGAGAWPDPPDPTWHEMFGEPL